MPELPEVETTVRALRPLLVGRTITGVRNDWPRHLGNVDLATLQQQVHGRSFQTVTRRGKYLVFNLSDGAALIIHLRMSGHLAVVDGGAAPQPYVHTIFTLENGQELRFKDPRKFGKVYLTHDLAEVLGALGPEPLATDFTAAVLQERLNGRKRALKPLLLDQTFIAGMGNIYADEALFAARLHPQRAANSLSQEEVVVLHGAIQRVLRLGIAREGASIDLYVKPDGTRGDMQNAVNVFRRTGQPCSVCGRPIERMVLGGRSTHFCADCQI